MAIIVTITGVSNPHDTPEAGNGGVFVLHLRIVLK